MAEPNAFDFGLDIENLKRHKSPVNYQISAEVFKYEGSKIN